MKAIMYTAYGSPDVLELKEVAQPVPKENEVLIRMHATAVNSGDVKMRSFDFPRMYYLPMGMMNGFKRPRRSILGNVIAGEIESTGSGVTRFSKGDQVFGSTGMGMGAYAEYVCVPEQAAIGLKPSSITYEEAAAIPFGAYTALHFLRKAKLQEGSVSPSDRKKVLIVGASGSVGTAAVQLAKHFGARVTGVCSTANIGLVKSLGADRVVDYTKEDFAGSGETYDVIFDTVGKSSFPGSLRSLKPDGYYLLGAVWKMSWYVRAAWMSLLNMLPGRGAGQTVVAGVATENPEDLRFFTGLVEKGRLKPVIDRSYTMEQMAEAHRYVDGGHKKGNVIVTI